MEETMRIKKGAGNIFAGNGIKELNDNFPLTDLEDWMLLSQTAHWIQDHEGQTVEVLSKTAVTTEIQIGTHREIVTSDLLEETIPDDPMKNMDKNLPDLNNFDKEHMIFTPVRHVDGD
jgi:hypothetical protein